MVMLLLPSIKTTVLADVQYEILYLRMYLEILKIQYIPLFTIQILLKQMSRSV
jgi:hypothetical protein